MSDASLGTGDPFTPTLALPDTIAQDVLARVDAILPQAGGPHPLHAPEIDGNAWDYVKDCLDTGWVSSVGAWVDRFEDMLADITGARHAIATINGTAALHAALLTAGVKSGDEVLVPSFTFVATANAISYCGASPNFVDCEATGLGIDPIALEEYLDRIGEVHGDILINRQTGAVIRAMVPVHCYGHPADMRALCEIADRYHLIIVEDAAESLGSTIGGMHMGRFERIGAFSFNDNKTITTGGGGALITDDDLLARRLRHLTTTARVNDGADLVHDMIGYNYRLPNINAALGCAQLETLDQKLAAKRDLAARYRETFADADGVRYVSSPPWGESNNWLCGILFDKARTRDLALTSLNAAGYQSRPFWAPLHSMKMYADGPRAPLPITDRLSACGLTLPSGAGLKGEIKRQPSIDR
ncbi:MAG: LegC family aminotransferase [Rhodospirillaceae bacterium]|jgi:perosamine synthetase|nr:LegC family aminotransferase [Rhodospirillaceae bacterium]MBT3808570.1 LegC family aminotransferase [Rhodospirillaceae bacterium]MBT3929881.1 LegC family aminotransferase [Rhodospirillaceae bacterium]MBT4773590.1 LegC family aminotransferase [Rhodospirillaceae bacterium]MBT5360010.1 LegC family aminotransferase [Rhodospirillaceae bacterium]